MIVCERTRGELGEVDDPRLSNLPTLMLSLVDKMQTCWVVETLWNSLGDSTAFWGLANIVGFLVISKLIEV